MDCSGDQRADGLTEEHSNPFWSGQQDLRGRATTAKEQHVDFFESDTSQNYSDSRGSDRVPSTSARTVATGGGSTAFAGFSGSASDNLTYENSNHNDPKQSNFLGPVEFGSTINYQAGTGIQEALEKFAGTYCAQDASFNSQRTEHEPTCLEDTRVDLLQDIISWSNAPGDSCIFWLNGMAGTGKSTIARTVARIWHDKKQLGASFFFSRGHGDLAHASKFFPTLAYQLARSQSSLAADIHKAVCDDPRIGSRTLRDQWKHLILEPLSQLNDQLEPMIVVIDALDECDDVEDAESILQLISQAKTLSSVRLLVFVTSRPETPIHHGFHALPGDIHRDFVLHQISDSVVGRDISVFLRHEFGMIRTRRRLPKEWPTEESLDLLVRKAGGLFIYAATVCRFVGHKDGSPENRLHFVLEDSIEDGSPTEQLDLIYTKILQYVVGDQQEQLLRFRQIVGSIVILFDALTTVALAELLRAKQWEVEAIVDSLSSVLDYSQNIRLLHPSFRDFLLDDRRCIDPRFRIVGSDAHRDLAVSCLEHLPFHLKMDICSLKLPGTLTSDVDRSTIQRCLPQQVQYMCRYWVDHLRRSNTVLRSEARRHNRVHNFLKDRFGHWVDAKRGSLELSVDEQLHNHVHTFVKGHVLHWLEALSLTGNISGGILGLKTLESMLTSDADQHLRAMAHDAVRFVLHFRPLVEEAPLQIYCSALAFSPKQSILRNQFRRDVPGWITNLPEVNEEWDSKLHVLGGHSAQVTAVSFSSDGKLLASASKDHSVRLWDLTTGTCRFTLWGHSDWVRVAVFSPDDKHLASASGDNTLRLWDPATGICRFTLTGHSDLVRAVAFSPDGKVLASASDNTVRLWDSVMGICRTTLRGHSHWVRAVVFSPDGKLLASASDDKTVWLWDPMLGTCHTILRGHSHWVRAVVFSPDGTLLASASGDNTVRLWDPTTGNCHATLRGHANGVWAVGFSPDGKLIASASADNTVRLWNPATGTHRATLRGHSDWVWAVVFSPDSRLLASVSDDNTVRLWDPSAGTRRATLKGHSGRANTVAFSPDSMLLASTSLEEIRLWDPSTRAPRATAKRKSKQVNAVTFSPDDKFLASASNDKTVQLWDATNGVRRATFTGHSKSVMAVAFSPDGTVLASASIDKTVRLWDASTGTCRAILKGHSVWGRAVRFLLHDRRLSSPSNGKTIRLWNATNWIQRATFKGHSDSVVAVAFSPDGKLLASASHDNTVLLWNATTGTYRATLSGHSHWVRAVMFSPDGRLLASASNDKTIRLWDSTTGSWRATLTGHSDWVRAVAFSPDSKLLASASYDKTVRLWDPTAGTCLGIAEGHPNGAEALAFSYDGKIVVSTSSDCTSSCFNIDDVPPITEDFLLTDREHRPRTTPSAPLYISGEWICFGARKLLCVPPDYRTNILAIRNNFIVLKHPSGEVYFIVLDLDSLPVG